MEFQFYSFSHQPNFGSDKNKLSLRKLTEFYVNPKPISMYLNLLMLNNSSKYLTVIVQLALLCLLLIDIRKRNIHTHICKMHL